MPLSCFACGLLCKYSTVLKAGVYVCTMGSDWGLTCRKALCSLKISVELIHEPPLLCHSDRLSKHLFLWKCPTSDLASCHTELYSKERALMRFSRGRVKNELEGVSETNARFKEARCLSIVWHTVTRQQIMKYAVFCVSVERCRRWKYFLSRYQTHFNPMSYPT